MPRWRRSPSAFPLPKPEQHPFRHSIFRSAHVEVELLRNELVRLQIRLEIDIEKFDENDLDPTTGLNPGDGIVTGFLELRRNPDPAASPRYSWELDLLSSPEDVDGMAAFISGGSGGGLVAALGGPSIALPGFAAVSGGRTGPTGLVLALGIGLFMQEAGFFEVERLIWRGLRFRLLHGGDNPTRFSLALDYAVKYMIDVDLFSIGIPVRLQTSRPLEIAFRNVGVEIINRETVELFYDPASGFKLDINDPGVFQLGDGIGRLLRVDRTTLGFGSPLFLEVELGFALDLGIFTVDTLRIRMSLESDNLFRADANGVVHLDGSDLQISDVHVTINKLGVGVDVPGVIEGRGELGINDDGVGGTTVEGELELSFESMPMLRSIFGALKIYSRDDLKALYLALGVEFVPGLPLGNTGIAIYGLHGLLGVNMGRSIPEPLAWLKAPPVGVTDTNKWVPSRGTWTFGVGATLGTVFDAGFAIHLKGTLLLETPGPRFILAAQVEIFQILPEPEDPPVGILATVMLDLENDLLTVGIDYTLTLTEFIELHVPTEAFFNLDDPLDFHLRFGEWLPKERRAGVRVFDLFNAWGYLQIEGNGLDNGALDTPLVGICVGAGARIEIVWGRKGILYLEAFAEAHAGIQLAPLYFEGSLVVGGELHVGPISIGARGELTAKVMVSAPRFLSLRGEVCGYIDLWFTTLEKCVGFEIGDGDPPTPAPLNPFGDAVAIDRMTAQAIEVVNDDGEIVVPIDALFHLAFTSDVTDGRPNPGITFTDQAKLLNQVSGDLYYRFTLDELRLQRVGGAVVTGIQSAWAPYSLLSGPPEAADSQRTLRVLDWMPDAHPRQLDFGSVTESTLSQLIARLCSERVPPTPRCADFDEERLGHRSRWRLDHRTLRPVDVITTRADGLGTEASSSGSLLLPARVVPLVDADYPGRSPSRRCLDLGRPSPRSRTPITELIEEPGAEHRPGGARQAGPDLYRRVGSGDRRRRAAATLAGAARCRRHHRRRAADGDAGSNLRRAARDRRRRRRRSAAARCQSRQARRPLRLLGAAECPRRLHLRHRRRAHRAALELGRSGSRRGRRQAAERPLAAAPPAGAVRTAAAPQFQLLPHAGLRHHAQRLAPLPRAAAQCRAHHHRAADPQRARRRPARGARPSRCSSPAPPTSCRAACCWERFRSEDADEVDGDGTLPIDSTSFRRFRADPESPTDITRYVRDHDPVGEDQPHYFAEPLVLRFATATIDALFAAYGQQLVVRAKADHTGHVVAQPMAAIAGIEYVPVGPAETEIVAALNALKDKCLPGAWEQLFPKTIARIDQPLAPNTGYTVSVLPRALGEPGPLTFAAWDALLQQAFDAGEAVYRFDLRTSRWAGFAPHVAAYRAAPVGDLFIDRPAELDALLGGLGAGPLRSDEVVDRISELAFGGPLIIPEQPEMLRLWVPDGTGWRCRGLLLDGPEPLLRRRRDADGNPAERIGIDARWVANVAVPFDLGAQFASLQIVAGARGARVFAFFTPPANVQPGAVVLRLADLGTEFAPPSVEALSLPLGTVPQVLSEEAA